MTVSRSSVLDRIGTVGRSSRWLREHLDYPHKDWCLLWPFSRNENGYGLYGLKNLKVHRLMCEYVHGPAPEDKPEANGIAWQPPKWLLCSMYG